MTITSTRSLWTVHNDHDLDQASDRHSRYGAYLWSRLEQLDERRTPEEWVAWCWSVATTPIMSPGYARWGDSVESTDVYRDSWDGSLRSTVVVRSALPARLPRHSERAWRGWGSSCGGEIEDPRWSGYHGPTALGRVELDGPLPGRWERPAEVGPRRSPGCPNLGNQRAVTRAAKATVAEVVSALCHEFGPAVQALR